MNKSFSFIFACVLLLQISPALAGQKEGNGGDMCEDRIKVIADDIATWISKGGSAGLSLPHAATLDAYNQQMHDQIKTAQVSCVDDKIMVGTKEKTCKNLTDPQGIARIICNNDRFLKTSDSDQYVLVHHEYAGLAGIEINDGESSNYSLSNQISGYLENQIVKKLAIKPLANGLASVAGETLYQKLANLYDAGALMNPMEYVNRAAIGRCFTAEAPNLPYPSFFLSTKTKTYPDAGPIGEPYESYSSIAQISANTAANFYDKMSFDEIMKNKYWNLSFFRPMTKNDERTYSVQFNANDSINFRISAGYLVAFAQYMDSRNHKKSTAHCYYFKLN